MMTFTAANVIDRQAEAPRAGIPSRGVTTYGPERRLFERYTGT